MTDQDGSPSSQRLLSPLRLSNTSSARRGSGCASYEIGGSNVRDECVVGNSTTLESTSDSTLAAVCEGNLFSHVAEVDGLLPRRPHKPRSAGGFLLSAPQLGGGDNASALGRGPPGNNKAPPHDRKGKKLAMTQQPSTLGVDHARQSQHGAQEPGRSKDDVLHRPSGDMIAENPTGQDITRRASQLSSAQPVIFDNDSANIVKMALSLSESRRMASRRNMSNPLPPSLAPVPDSVSGGSLKQHLQRQRRTSRTVSPVHRRLPAHTLPSLPVTLDPEPPYRYHFSQSTLARAQKAKDHLELMAQYRRLLDFIPPLDHSSLSHQTTASCPNPQAKSRVLGRKLGRPYNPLQYIRNRKLRQRERHAISGESCGFRDVIKVSSWVDDVAKRAATRPDFMSDGNPLPTFGKSEAKEEYTLNQGLSKPTLSILKPRRPRIDWVIDPADMIADVYWLEQGNHKMLIEDRHWCRIFPQGSELYVRPGCKREDSEEQPSLDVDLAFTADREDPGFSITEAVRLRAESGGGGGGAEQVDQASHSARGRAQSKLRDLRDKSHKYTSSAQSADLLRFRRRSIGDSSDSDNDALRRRARAGTISARSSDVLEKQIMDAIAKEAREKEFDSQRTDSDTMQMSFPKRAPLPLLKNGEKPGPFIRKHGRKESRLTEISDADEKGASGRFWSKTSSPLGSARASLEIPRNARVSSLDLDRSLPNSPGMRASTGGSGMIPPIGLELSPPNSRTSSPTRNPFSKVKQKIFQERSRERSGESKNEDKEISVEHRPSTEKARDDSQMLSPGGHASLDKGRPSSVSPVRRTDAGTGEAQRGHNRMGSIRIRDEIGGPRGIFKKPRIDAIIRGSVSRVGDMIWRKGQGNEGSDSDKFSEESDFDELRGGKKKDQPGSPGSRRPREPSDHSPKHFLDVMPPFIPTSASRDATMGATISAEMSDAGDKTTVAPPSPSWKRFDKLKRPRISGAQALPPSATSPKYTLPCSKDSDRSTTESRSRSASFAEATTRSRGQPSDTADSVPAPSSALFVKPSHFSTATIQPRPWSVPEMDRTHDHSNTVSRRQVARIRTLMLSTGIKALEISRRAQVTKTLSQADELPPSMTAVSNANGVAMNWREIADLAPPEKSYLAHKPVSQTHVFPCAAQILSASIAASTDSFHTSANDFVLRVVPAVLEDRIAEIRGRVNDELSSSARLASDKADGLSRDLLVGQRIKMKRVNEAMDKIQRQRRRRFRWLRRAGWLAVEWALVGFMWYVWFIVVVVRIVLGVVGGIWRGMRWLCWL